jgi:hypothetical protein
LKLKETQFLFDPTLEENKECGGKNEKNVIKEKVEVKKVMYILGCVKKHTEINCLSIIIFCSPNTAWITQSTHKSLSHIHSLYIVCLHLLADSGMPTVVFSMSNAADLTAGFSMVC